MSKIASRLMLRILDRLPVASSRLEVAPLLEHGLSPEVPCAFLVTNADEAIE